MRAKELLALAKRAAWTARAAIGDMLLVELSDAVGGDSSANASDLYFLYKGTCEVPRQRRQKGWW